MCLTGAYHHSHLRRRPVLRFGPVSLLRRVIGPSLGVAQKNAGRMQVATANAARTVRAAVLCLSVSQSPSIRQPFLPPSFLRSSTPPPSQESAASSESVNHWSPPPVTLSQRCNPGFSLGLLIRFFPAFTSSGMEAVAPVFA